MATATPTILVKKTDGTFVRMSLSELKKKTSPSAVSVKPAVKKTENLDFAAPMAEELAPATNAGPRTSASRIDQVDAMIKKMSFTVPTQNGNRFRTIIQLCLKEVRTMAQTRDSLLRAELEGGMALSPAQAEEVMNACSAFASPALRATADKAESVKPLKPKMGEKSTTDLERILPTPRPSPPFPTVSTPNNAFVHEVKKVAPASEAMPKPFKIAPEINAHKTAMHDVTAVKPAQMTPVDEIRFFSLLDFRRLSGDPAEAARRLKQKFINLQEESVILYLQAISAWKASPLYADYLNTVLGSLAGGQKITTPRDKKLLQYPEFQAVVNMEKTMDYL